MNEKANADKRVILITGDEKKWFEQAIFIMKKDFPRKETPKDIITEAERLINGYMLTLTAPRDAAAAYALSGPATKMRVAPKRKNKNLVLSFLMIACCVILTALICQAFL